MTSLEQIYLLPEQQIQEILRANNYTSQNYLTDRLIVTIILTNQNKLNPEDAKLVSMGDQFNRLYLSSDADLVKSNIFRIPLNRFQLIRKIVSNIASSGPGPGPAVSKQESPVLKQEPILTISNQGPILKQEPELVKPVLYVEYRPDLSRKLVVCGKKTYELRNELKKLGGFWNPELKCWTFLESSRNQIETFISGVLQQESKQRTSKQEQQQFTTVTENLSASLQKLNLNTVSSVSSVSAGSKSSQAAGIEAVIQKFQTAASAAGLEQQAAIEPYIIIENGEERYDIKQLEVDWDSKIKLVKSLYYTPVMKQGLMTYDGPIMPPDAAFASYLDGWSQNFGFLVEQLAPRLYKVTVNTD